MSGDRAKATVTGSNIDTVAFYVGGKHVKTVTRPAAGGGYVLSMSCAHLGVGAHRARAAVTFQAGASPTRTTLHFQITRARQTSPQFTG